MGEPVNFGPRSKNAKLLCFFDEPKKYSETHETRVGTVNIDLFHRSAPSIYTSFTKMSDSEDFAMTATA